MSRRDTDSSPKSTKWLSSFDGPKPTGTDSANLSDLPDPNVPAPSGRIGLYELEGILLPVTLAEMNMQDVSRKRLLDFAETVSGTGSFVHNHPFNVTPEMIVSAMVAADSLGNRRKTV